LKCPVLRNAKTTAPAGLPCDFNRLAARLLPMIPDFSLALLEAAKEPALKPESACA